MITGQQANSDFSRMITNLGNDLQSLSKKQPILLIFLRHFGCTFCREALDEISEKKKEIEDTGVRVVFVHMADDEVAERYFKRYELDNSEHISDPNSEYYKKFGLVRGNFNQLFGLQTWLRGFSAGVVKGHGIGSQLGDGFQMPGVFVIQNGEIKEKFIHQLASDRPDYEKLVQICKL